MKSKTTISLLAAGVLALAVGLVFGTAFGPAPAPTAREPVATSVAQAPNTLRVTNDCGFPIWLAAEGLPTAPPLTRLAEDAHVDFAVSPAGVPSTRFWAKAMCDDAGAHCTMGQSVPPCPKEGCAPPVDSKLEATFPCLQDAGCTTNPSSGKPLTNVLWWNASAADGYTLPFAVRATPSAGCPAADCSGLKITDCPVSDDLSDDGKNPAYKHEDEHVRAEDGGLPAGCFAPYMKLNYPGWNGEGLQDPSGPVEKMYACPTPPVSPDACRAGPVTRTKYVELVHAACKESVYAFAYDDGVGLRACPGGTTLEFVLCPKQAR